jgi:streptomycin 6-kinase
MIDAYQRHRDELAAILDPRKHTIGWLDVQVTNGAIRVLATDKSIILFEFKTYPTGYRELHGMAAAGDMGDITDILIPQAEQLAVSMKCGAASIASVAAWARILKGRGYMVNQVIIEKDLQDGVV